MRRTPRTFTLLATLLASACADVVAPDGASRDLDIVVPAVAARRVIVDTSARAAGPRLDVAPEGLSSDWVSTATSLTPSVDVGFSDGHAYGQALLQYVATDAEATIDIKVSLNSAPLNTLGSNSGHESKSTFLPLFWGGDNIVASTNLYVNETCSHHVGGHGAFAVFNKALVKLSWTSWGQQSTTVDRDASAPECPPTYGGSTSTNDGGSKASGSTSDAYEVCWYVAVFDASGNFMYAYPIGCYIVYAS